MPQSEIVLSLGSNLPHELSDAATGASLDSPALLAQVVALLQERGELVAVSDTFLTPAWGGVAQPDFYNAAAVVRTSDAPRVFLHRMQAWELEYGRQRLQYWGPRTLDIDLIQVRQEGVEITSSDAELTLPHPYAAQRAFVLLPWAQLEPEAQLAGIPIQQLLTKLEADCAQIQRLGA